MTFGTGYSNMAYLKQFAADKLKIDRSFISKLDSKSDVSILEAIITLAHNFNLIAIAEGVEMVKRRHEKRESVSR
ncbi:EAL domain-containing protein [Pseudoalteromonas sp. Hal099]